MLRCGFLPFLELWSRRCPKENQRPDGADTTECASSTEPLLTGRIGDRGLTKTGSNTPRWAVGQSTPGKLLPN